jgi:hypothetical protein
MGRYWELIPAEAADLTARSDVLRPFGNVTDK